MGPALERWLKALTAYQKRRGEGKVAHPWADLDELDRAVDPLIREGLDSRAAAAALVELERAGLYFEQRDFTEGLRIANACEPTVPLSGWAAELVYSNRDLLIGSVYLVRDEDYALAADHFQKAIDASGPMTVFNAGQAGINLGICHHLLGSNSEALKAYEQALVNYQLAGRRDKQAVALHSIANVHRAGDKFELGIQFLQQALTISSEDKNYASAWAIADDLSRTYLSMADTNTQEANKWHQLASKMSDIAFASAWKVWDVQRHEEGRLRDLADQMINLTVTRCEIAVRTDDPPKLLGTLASMKGRIRLLITDIPDSLIGDDEDEIREGLTLGVPSAYTHVVINAFKMLAPDRTVALLEHIALRSTQLIVTYCIISKDGNRPGGFHSALPEQSAYDPSLDLRGRARGKELVDECQKLLNELRIHTHRCSLHIPNDGSDPSDSALKDIERWAAELEPTLNRLGEVFFPGDILDAFRAQNVEHVVLAMDPLLIGVPYSALVGKYGAIVDEPWTLSLVTASTELVRAVDRGERHPREPLPLAWFGPDKDVNDRLGGSRELDQLAKLAAVVAFREDTAKLPTLIKQLNAGHWCHFRGHARWTGDVETSGPVLAPDDILSTQHYQSISGQQSFLFTAACLTGFGSAVGIELVGSVVDYDRANLSGAVLTSWPIDGNAATAFTNFFYEELKQCADIAIALKLAAQRTRVSLPHPCLWAPFFLMGDWRADALIEWRDLEE